jgi:antitoxin component YwqK of YwqJK toxin-antitoxin module
LLKQDRFKNEDFEISEVNDSYGLRYYIDSKNYDIFNGFYNNGNTDVEFVRNKNLQVEEENWFYENGQLKECGARLYNDVKIGKWKYYSPTGQLDSLVDYDKKYKIPYSKAVEIAKTNGFILPNCEFHFSAEKNKPYWTILRWTVDQDKRGSTGEGIEIDAQSGKISKAPTHHGIY